ncbi:MAG: RAMP superfamily CRISPR-associated protein [Polyangia bacterium]
MSLTDGYEFVELPPGAVQVHRARRGSAVFHRRVEGSYSGSLVVRFSCEQLVHIGTGYKQLLSLAAGAPARIVREGARVMGRPGIPGSSLKGALRSRFEAITRSCIQGRPPERSAVRSQSTDIRRAELSTAVLNQDVLQACRVNRKEPLQSELCPACALFGLMSLRGRITCTDLMTPQGTEFTHVDVPEPFGPNLHHVGEVTRTQDGEGKPCFLVRRLHGRKFAMGRGPVPPRPNLQPVEAIPSGCILDGSLLLTNVTLSELGGVLAALGHLPESPLKIGGARGQGLGRLQLANLQFDLEAPDGTKLAKPAEALHQEFLRSQDVWPAGLDKLVRVHLAERGASP